MFDAIVIGGGLAGCSSAITLAQYGHRVALLEAGSYPRAKVCGEFLSPESIMLFRQLGFLDHLYNLHPTTINTMRVTSPEGMAWCERFPAPALSISRYALDDALVSHAATCSVTIMTNTKVTDVSGRLVDSFQVHAQSKQGRKQMAGAAIIAAHGRQSNLDRIMKRSNDNQQSTYIGLKQHYHGALLPEHIDLHMFPGGYCGISQVEDERTNVCLLVKESVFKEVTSTAPYAIEAFVDWMGAANDQLGRWIADAVALYPEWLSISQVSLAPKSPLAGDILCTGDACGMVAPLAGDGMAMALHSGIIAGNTLHQYLTGQMDAETMKRHYTDQWQQTFNMRLRVGRILQSMIMRPKILNPGLRLLGALPPIGKWLIRNTRDMGLLGKTT